MVAGKSRKTLRVLLFSAEVVRKLNFPNNSIDGLGSSYHIGGAYFLKKDARGNVISGAEPDYDALWTLRLEPLLKEYLRGTGSEAELNKTLKPAFFGAAAAGEAGMGGAEE